MQIFQDEIFRTKTKLREVNEALTKRIDELEARIQKLEELLAKQTSSTGNQPDAPLKP